MVDRIFHTFDKPPQSHTIAKEEWKGTMGILLISIMIA
jgi:hypothetical protein